MPAYRLVNDVGATLERRVCAAPTETFDEAGDAKIWAGRRVERLSATWLLEIDAPPNYDADIETRAATGQTIDGDTVAITYAVAAKSLAALKAAYGARVKADAEAERLRYITAGAGKALEYREKVSELAAWAADPADPKDAADYPLFSAEAFGLGITLAAARARVAVAYGLWKAIGAGILAVEMAAGKAIEEAADGAAVKAAYEAVTWPTPE